MIPPNGIALRPGTVTFWPKDDWVISEHTTDVVSMVIDAYESGAVRIQVAYDCPHCGAPVTPASGACFACGQLVEGEPEAVRPGSGAPGPTPPPRHSGAHA